MSSFRASMLLILVGIILLTTGVSSRCPAARVPFLPCTGTAGIILDTSAQLGNVGIYNEVNYIENYLLPIIGWGQQQTIGVFGVAHNVLQYDYSSSMAAICDDLDGIIRATENKPSIISLKDTLLHIVSKLPLNEKVQLVLLSIETSSDEIKSAGNAMIEYVENNVVEFTVIAFNGAPFSLLNFPASTFYKLDFGTIVEDASGLPDCLIHNMCGVHNTQCDVNKPGTRAVPGATQTTQAPAPVTDERKCTCNYTSLWNDVIILMDTSASLTDDEQEDILDLIKSQFGLLTVDTPTNANANNNKFYTSVGVITYADQATVRSSLGSLNGTSLFDLEIANEGGDANIAEGLQAAVDEFRTSPNNRKNARDVIILISNAYKPVGPIDPLAIRDEFLGNDGVIIVYDFAATEKQAEPELEEIASEGYYYISGKDVLGEDIRTGMCAANCFCKPQSIPFMTNDGNKTPVGGCYVPKSVSLNKQIAMKDCMKYDAVVALDMSEEKTTFLQSQVDGSVPGGAFWIGLTYDVTLKQYVWDDTATPLAPTYEPFSNYIAPATAAAGTFECVYVHDGKWIQSSCRNSRNFVCELAQCDSVNYCS